MSKLGYTWYPKDWGNSEAVFELNLTERGLYRELIDMAMLNDNTTVINSKVWCRKFDIEHDSLWLIIEKIKELKLIELINEDSEGDDYILFIPSCEPRLKLSRGGRNGGKKSKKSKPTVKPIVSLFENKDKPTPNQIESKVKEIESKDNISTMFTHESFLIWFKDCRQYLGLQYNVKRLSITEKQLFNELKDYTKEDFKLAFKNFSNDKYWSDNNLLLPSYFLKSETFTKYLNAEVKKQLTLGEKLIGKTL